MAERMTVEQIVALGDLVDAGETVPRRDAAALLAEVDRLRAIIYPAPEQLTRMEQLARQAEAYPQNGNASAVWALASTLGEHVLALGAALREAHAQAVASEGGRRRAEADRDRLAARLTAAEAVCLLFGWSPSRSTGTDREKAAYMLWSRWHDLVGRNFTDPRKHPELSHEVIADLARQRDEVRARVLRGQPAGEVDGRA